MRMSTPRQRVITNIAFVVAFVCAAHYAAPKAGSGASVFVVMWTPALAALAASVLTRRSLGAAHDVGRLPAGDCLVMRVWF